MAKSRRNPKRRNKKYQGKKSSKKAASSESGGLKPPEIEFETKPLLRQRQEESEEMAEEEREARAKEHLAGVNPNEEETFSGQIQPPTVEVGAGGEKVKGKEFEGEFTVEKEGLPFDEEAGQDEGFRPD